MILLGMGLAVSGLGCGVAATAVPSRIDLPAVEPVHGTAVVILVDTSGSMRDGVRDHDGKQRPKDTIARAALEKIVQATADWKKTHADQVLQLGILEFSDHAERVLPMGSFDQARSLAAVKKIRAPDGGTAIGLALEDGFKALYGTGCDRKFLLCITDGENTVGPPPDAVARQLFDQTKGQVEIHFIAFDTSAAKFGFLKDVNGHSCEAADAAQLQAELTRIYEKRILAEMEEPGK
jgi:hypothetical protein